MSGFLLIVDVAPGPVERSVQVPVADYTAVKVPLGLLYLQGPSATVVDRGDRHATVHHGEWLQDSEMRRLRDLPPVPASSWKEHRGTVIRIDGADREVHLATDLVGSFPVYYGVDAEKTRFVAGSHFAEVQAQLRHPLDPTGCYEFLTAAYTVGGRTVAEGIRQLTIHETLAVTACDESVRLQIEAHPTLWDRQGEQNAEAELAALTELWLEETALLDDTQVMMSAGWDSRAILAGAVANGLHDSLLAYSHGDLEGRELRLAGRICRTAGVTHVAEPLEEYLFGPEAAARVLAETDTYIFPYWWRAAARGRQEYGVSKLTGGLYGPVLGGHNNVPDKGTKSARLTALARYLAGGDHPANGNPARERDAARQLILPTQYHRLWCFNEGFHEQHEPDMVQRVRADCEGAFGNYERAGIGTVEHLVEAFEVDHRLRQYINGQLISGTGQLRARNPFTNPTLLHKVTRLPLSAKVHNLLHQAIIRRIAPKLLRYPMAATLVPAATPIAVQEISRVQRILFQRAAGTAHRLTGGLVPKPRMGWPAFQFLNEYQPFHDIVDSLQLEIWDKSRMHRVIRSFGGNLHPLFDMVGKCKTLDYRLTGRT